MTSPSLRQNVIVCEGYDDRAFWAGWLRKLGCEDARDSDGRARDPWGLQVNQGRYAFYTPKGEYVVVEPVGGRTKIKDKIDTLMVRQSTRPVFGMIVNFDSDDVGSSDSQSADDFLATVALQYGLEPAGSRTWKRDEFTLAGVVWEVLGDTPIGVPAKHTLERLVCCAIARGYFSEQCGDAVAVWLNAKPERLGSNDPGKDHKRKALSYASKWFADLGDAFFFEFMWRESIVSTEIERLLNESGAANIVRSFVNGTL